MATPTGLYSSSKPKMKQYPTKVINLIGGPGIGKSLYSAAFMLNLKLAGKIVEYVPEVAKSIVWQKKFELLENQHYVSKQQYDFLKVLDGEVQFIITDGPLAQQLYYNEHYKDNVCNVEKTKAAILGWLNQFENINIVLERGKYKYEKAGRYQSEEEAIQIDHQIKKILDREAIPYIILPADIGQINTYIRKNLL